MNGFFDNSESLHEYQLKAREIINLTERIDFLNKKREREILFSQSPLPDWKIKNSLNWNEPKEKTAIESIEVEIKRTLDLQQLEDIEAIASDLEQIPGLHYLIECKDTFVRSPEYVDMAGLSLLPLQYFTPQQFVKEIDKIMDKVRAEKPKAEFEKIKWNGSVAALGFILSQLAEKGFINWPLDRRHDPKYKEFARQMSKIFEYEGTLDTFLNALYPASDSLSDESKDKISIPFLKEL